MVLFLSFCLSQCLNVCLLQLSIESLLLNFCVLSVSLSEFQIEIARLKHYISTYHSPLPELMA